MASLDVSSASILSERCIRYKRNTLAASLIATVLYWTSAPLGEVSLFGISLSNVADKEAVAWLIFLVILSYQWVMLAYYGWTDWRIWRQRVRTTFGLSVRNAAFWIDEGTRLCVGGMSSDYIIQSTEKNPQTINWKSRDPNEAAREGNMRHDDRAHIRWRLLAFLTVEFGLPNLWATACLYLALSKIFD